MGQSVRILLLADSHLGFDLPVSPRINRRRRGHDFLANYAAALDPALRGDVDLVVHGGDVFNRSRPHSTVVFQAFEPLQRVADRGIPVFIVPGNHERGRIPHLRFAQHPNIFVFDQPRTYVTVVNGVRVAIAGFPSERDSVREQFPELLAATNYAEVDADIRLLCIHQCVEGATIGPSDYMFTTAPDVIRCSDIPAGFAAVLSGHIHRQQVLTTDVRGRPLAAPVLYPGSIERTSIAEASEKKGYLIVECDVRTDSLPVTWEFCPLPARPLVRHDLEVDGLDARQVENALRTIIGGAPGDAIVTVRVLGEVNDSISPVLAANFLRSLAPPTMNFDLRLADGPPPKSKRPALRADEILELPFQAP